MIRCDRPGCNRAAGYRLRAVRFDEGRELPVELRGRLEHVLCGRHADRMVRDAAGIPGAKLIAERVDPFADNGRNRPDDVDETDLETDLETDPQPIATDLTDPTDPFERLRQIVDRLPPFRGRFRGRR